MRKLIFRLTLPLTLISFGIITKWSYGIVIDGTDEFLYGFPLIYKCDGFHTSLSTQYFLTETIVNLLTYFSFWLIVTLILNRIWKINIPKLISKIFWIVYTVLFLGFIYLSNDLDDRYSTKRDFEVKIFDRGISIFGIHSTNREKYQLELNTQSEIEKRDYKNEISKFSLNFSPKGASALDSIPEKIIKGFRELRTIDKSAHEKYVTLIFTKLYAEHLQCCHQSYIIENFPRKKSEYDFEKLTMVNEFAFMSGYLDKNDLPEIWTSGIIEKWLAENQRLLKYEPIGKYNQFIKTVSRKIKNGDYWDNKE